MLFCREGGDGQMKIRSQVKAGARAQIVDLG